MEDFRAIGRRVSNWGRWGADDRVGTLNYITPEKLVEATRLVKRGAIFELSIPLDHNGPQLGVIGRNNPVHLMSLTPADFTHHSHGMVDDIICVDDYISMPLQGATQWDGLAHIAYDDRLYNDISTDSIGNLTGSEELSIAQIAKKGVMGKGILLDIARVRGVDRMDAGDAITPEDLEKAEARQGVKVGSGDILLLRTGWIQHFSIDNDKQAFWTGEPGIDLSCIDWLHEREVAALAMDNFAVEVLYPGAKDFPLPVHAVLIRDMGMTLGEIFMMDELAQDCEADGVWEFLLSAAPLKVTGGVGTPITPLAIK